MATLEDLRIADWAKPENAKLAEALGTVAGALRVAADRGVVGAPRARVLADSIDELLGGWASEARWWLRDYHLEIEVLLRSHTPAELIGEA